MKKILFTLSIIATAFSAQAKDIWTGNHNVAWDNTIYISAEAFSEAQIGDMITLNFTATEGDVIELKSDGKKLPGTRFYPFYADNTKMETYITADMLAVLKKTGMEVCGNKFCATSVAVDNVGYQMPEGAVWAGWFWCDDWKTLELWREAFDAYAGQRYLIVNISEEPFDYSYDFNIISTWDKGAFANWENTTQEKTRIVLDTQKLEGGLLAAIEGNDRVMFQGNCQLEGHGFNITSIVLTNDDVTGISNTLHQPKNSSHIYDLQGRMISNPSRGLYIANGKKYITK